MSTASVGSHDTHSLGETIASIAAGLHAATYQLLVLLREFDARNGWNNGFLSCAHWLHSTPTRIPRASGAPAWRTGFDLGASREKVRVARALPALPRIACAMERGQLSYAKVRALTRVATPGNEAALLDVALAGTAAHVERLVRAWRRVDRSTDARIDEVRHLNRTLSMWVDDDGTVVIRGRLTPEAGAVMMRAVDAAADRLFRESRDVPAAQALTDEVTPGQRRADAPIDYTTAVIELDHDAQHVSAETSRRVSCDAAMVTMTHSADGSVLDEGRQSRSIPPAIRRALAARDRTCRFPGCTSRRCEAHHIKHWADGGPTRLDNLVLLCRRHHRAVHEGGFRVAAGEAGAMMFRRPDGVEVPHAAPLVDRLALADVHSMPPPPTWDGTPLDVAWAIDVLWRDAC